MNKNFLTGLLGGLALSCSSVQPEPIEYFIKPIPREIEFPRAITIEGKVKSEFIEENYLPGIPVKQQIANSVQRVPEYRFILEETKTGEDKTFISYEQIDSLESIITPGDIVKVRFWSDDPKDPCYYFENLFLYASYPNEGKTVHSIFSVIEVNGKKVN